MGRPEVLWSHGGLAWIGEGATTVVDPGLGPDRYSSALRSLQESGQGTGFASFTFDERDPGSVLLIPEVVTIVPSEQALAPGPRPKGGRVVSTGEGAWREAYATAIEAIEVGDVDKVVLARAAEIELGSATQPLDVLSALGELDRGSYLFSIHGLVGASPELLVSMSVGRVEAFPLAGTATEEAGLAGAKVKLEHELTADAVLAALSPHLSGKPAVTREIVDLRSIMHQGTRIAGQAREGTTIADLLGALHPTPAVCGVPTGSAMDLIRRLEPRGRGRYAGPVGRIESDGSGEFALALRCGLIDGSSATLYAGGGLVRGSTIEDELAETGLKMASMLTALGLPA